MRDSDMDRGMDAEMDPDWDTPIRVNLTPNELAQSLFGTAHQVHTGWESCVDSQLLVASVSTERDENRHCLLAEQEYEEENEPSLVWHDWGVELRFDNIFLTGHWRCQVGAGAEWQWCAREAERAFTTACVLLGRRVAKGLVVVEPVETPAATRH